jgi:charged multivesicular body protein 7
MTFKEILETRPNASKARIPALYADFRPLKQNNPEGYEANIRVWQSALSTAVKDGVLSMNDSILVLDVTSQLLSDVSVSPWGRPLGLGSVMVEFLLRLIVVTVE